MSSAQNLSLSSSSPEPHLAEYISPPRPQISFHPKDWTLRATLLPLPVEEVGPPGQPTVLAVRVTGCLGAGAPPLVLDVEEDDQELLDDG